MTTSSTVQMAPPAPNLQSDDLGIDRAFLLQMAQVPFFAILFVALAWVGHQIWQLFAPETALNLGPVVVICLGMILAAVIDGWAFKVPNWLTLSLVVSGWIIGLLHSFEVPIDAGIGGIKYALVGTFVGFILLFPMLFIGGMGQGDVKMQMGFGAWIGAYFGNGENLDGTGTAEIVFWSFAFGAIIGGVFGLVIMALRRKFSENAGNFKEIFTDLHVMAVMGPGKAAERANARRPRWVKLPYGVPLCAGFLGYLYFKLTGMI